MNSAFQRIDQYKDLVLQDDPNLYESHFYGMGVLSYEQVYIGFLVKQDVCARLPHLATMAQRTSSWPSVEISDTGCAMCPLVSASPNGASMGSSPSTRVHPAAHSLRSS